MTLRCGCLNEGDETVFGSRHACELPERTAVPGESLPPIPDCAYPPDATPLTEGVAAADLQFELDRLEHPYESVLHDDVPGDLG